MELVKPIVRVGNSAGVILPKEWLNGVARIFLIKKPLNIRQDVLGILEDYLPSILGIYLVGSYARKEQNEKSDIDILAITQNINKKMKTGKYEINLVSLDSLEETLKNNLLPLLPMLKEAAPIINKKMLEPYKSYPITKVNMQWHIDTTISALKVIKESIDLAKESDEKLSDNIAYSLVLRLREAYIVNCLLKDKVANNKELLNLIKVLTGSTSTYESYQRSKSNIKAKRKINVYEAESLYNYVSKLIEEQKRWIKRKG